MDKYASDSCDPRDAHSAADSLQKDFSELIGLFDRQLEKLPALNREARSHISEAKVAAERGLKLSRELVELLRKPA